jgi:uncharacterized protein (DUF305 family)
MNKESILYGIIGLLAGGLIMGATAVVSVNNNHTGMMRMMGMHQNSTSTMMNDDSMGMDDMTSNLKSKTGDDFDKTFVAQMIVHHQGAVDMANAAKQTAKHDEIKKMADDIISAQTKEIEQMKQWQKDWHYPTDNNSMGGMH